MNKGIIKILSPLIITGMLVSGIPSFVYATEGTQKNISENQIQSDNDKSQTPSAGGQKETEDGQKQLQTESSALATPTPIPTPTPGVSANEVSENEVERPIDTSPAVEAFSELVNSKILMAVVDAGRKVTVFEDSKCSKAMTTLESGYTVYPTGVVIEPVYDKELEYYEYPLVYEIRFYQDANEKNGYIRDENIVYTDEDWKSWEEEMVSNLTVSFPMMLYGADSFSASYASDSMSDDVKQFPQSYQTALQKLKTAHPQWRFIRQNVGAKFETAVNSEMGDKSWVYNNSANRSKGFVGAATGQANWNYATKAGVSFFMDPRNYLDESHIFAFEQLTYNSSYHTKEAVQSVLSNTFMKGTIPGDSRTYAEAFFTIGKNRKLSPTHLASRVYQEQGAKGTSPLISGTYTGYEGYYNFFNIGATGSTTADVIKNGLAYAKKHGWNSRYKSLEGGADAIGNNYILRGQDTIYYQKYNVAPHSQSAKYTHQYMQNIQAPYTEAVTTANMYKSAGSINGAFVFTIPVYSDMTSTPEVPVETKVALNQVIITNKEEATDLTLGEKRTLSVAFLPENTTESTIAGWTSSNPSVAEITSYGELTAKSPGTTTITVTMGESKKTDSFTVTVTACTVTILKADKKTTAKTMQVGYGYTLMQSDFPEETTLGQADGSPFLGWYTWNGEKTGQQVEEGFAVHEKNVAVVPLFLTLNQEFYIPPIGDAEYTGAAIKPAVVVYDSETYQETKEPLKPGVDYTVSYKNNKNAAAGDSAKPPTIIVTGKGNYSGSQKIYFNIFKKSLRGSDITVTPVTLAYNGKVQKGNPVVYRDGKKLVKNTDYTVSYPQKGTGCYKNTGTWPIVITGKGGYTDSITVNEVITKSTLMSKTSVSKIANQQYDPARINKNTGIGIEPDFTVRYNKKTLTKGVDYTVSYLNNMDVGTASVIITAKDGSEYTGTKKVTFKIVGKSLSKAKVSGIVSKTFSQNPDEMLQSGYTVTLGDTVLTESLDEGRSGDYKVSYQSNTKAGTAKITFEGVNGYSGKVKKTYKISTLNLANLEADGGSLSIEGISSSYSFTKGGVKPKPVVKYLGKELKENKDYTISYSNNGALNDCTNPKRLPTVTIKGKGNYSGTVKRYFVITKRDFTTLQAGISASDVIYNRKRNGFKATPVIKDPLAADKKLAAGTDYSKTYRYVYENDTDLDGDGIADKSKGTPIESTEVLPVGTVIRVYVAGKGGTSGFTEEEISCIYRITKCSLNSDSVKAKVAPQYYTGKSIKPSQSAITLTYNKAELADNEYEIIAYGENIKKGTGTIVVRGLGDFGGTRRLNFTIKSRSFLFN